MFKSRAHDRAITALINAGKITEDDAYPSNDVEVCYAAQNAILARYPDVKVTAEYEDTLEQTADRMFTNQLDYTEVAETTLYSYMVDGLFEVWIVDGMDSCNMDDAIKLSLVKSYVMGH